MPAASVTENVFTAAAGATATQADAAPRNAPATRYKVRIINTNASYRLHVATTKADAEMDTADLIEMDGGIWDAFLEAGVAVWVRPVSGTPVAIVVRIIQFAT